MNVNEDVKVEIDFSDLEEIYVGNQAEFVLILKKIQQEYEKYLTLLEDQIKSENMEEFRKVRHKISATLLLLSRAVLLQVHEDRYPARTDNSAMF